MTLVESQKTLYFNPIQTSTAKSAQIKAGAIKIFHCDVRYLTTAQKTVMPVKINV